MTATPQRVLVFGASGHIGGPLAEHVLAQEPGPKLRLATSSADKKDELLSRFPDAEVVVASYLDLPSMIEAFQEIDAAFVLTPDLTIDEQHAMANVVAAAYHAGTSPHIVRLTGARMGIDRLEDLPSWMREQYGSALQFQQARAILNASGLPVSYLNTAAYFMDDFFSLWITPLVERHVYAAPYNRYSSFVDTRDLGEAAANLLRLPHDRHHDGFVHHVTGTRQFMLSEVADLLSEVFDMEITYEDDPGRFADENREVVDSFFGPGTTDYFLKYYRQEQNESPLFCSTDILPRLLGRPARTLREWLIEHEPAFREAGLK